MNDDSMMMVISKYSTLQDALNMNVHGKKEPSVHVSTTRETPQILATYDACTHYLTYSSLSGALGG